MPRLLTYSLPGGLPQAPRTLTTSGSVAWVTSPRSKLKSWSSNARRCAAAAPGRGRAGRTPIAAPCADRPASRPNRPADVYLVTGTRCQGLLFCLAAGAEEDKPAGAQHAGGQGDDDRERGGSRAVSLPSTALCSCQEWGMVTAGPPACAARTVPALLRATWVLPRARPRPLPALRRPAVNKRSEWWRR